MTIAEAMRRAWLEGQAVTFKNRLGWQITCLPSGRVLVNK